VKKVIITGSNGLLGQKLVKLFKSKKTYKIFALSRGKDRMINQEAYTYFNIDITQKNKLTELINKIQPHCIIHTAAMTNVDACELNQKDCDTINVEAVKTIVDLCKVNNTHLIHLSTDFIFDGEKKGYYKEEDKPNPVNYYGLSKLKSEEIILKAGIKHTIIRTILVYGLVDRNDRSNIILWVKNSIENEKPINVVTDQFRMPTLADDLAESCLLAIENDATGIYNVSSNELLSIYDIAIEVANTFNLNKKYIIPVKTSMLNLPAKRPPRTGFDLNKSITQLNLPSYTFSERLRVFKRQLSDFDRTFKSD
jgi:dTDP-4-dehydrorhamnose reductase